MNTRKILLNLLKLKSISKKRKKIHVFLNLQIDLFVNTFTLIFYLKGTLIQM